MIDLTYSKGKKKATRSEPVKSTASRVARTVAYKIAQRRSSAVPLMFSFIPRQPSVPKFDQISEMCVAAKSKDDDSIAKAVPR